MRVVSINRTKHQCPINNGQWTMKKTPKPKLISYLQTFLFSKCRKTFADLLNEGLAIKLDPNAKVSPKELTLYIQTKGSNISPNRIL